MRKLEEKFLANVVRGVEKAMSESEKQLLAWHQNAILNDSKYRDQFSKESSIKEMREIGQVLYPNDYQNDIANVIENREKHSDKDERGLLFEVIAHYIQETGWFGNAQVIKASEYDDHRGVDYYLLFDDGEKQDILAIDLTTAESEDKLSQKFNSIKAGIKSKKLATIKYFDPEIIESKKPLSEIPRVVLAANPEQLTEMAKSLLTSIDNQRRKSSGMNDLKVKDQFIEAICAQLKEQIDLARQLEVTYSAPDSYKSVIDKISSTLEKIEEIKKSPTT